MTLPFFFLEFMTGLASAASLFLLAVGLSLIFGALGIVNFAHGSFFALGAYFLFALTHGDASGFWDLVQERKDDLNWCGSSPLYTFLQCAPKVHGTLRRYQQWNIDPGSVVSFAALEFAAAG